MHLDIFPRNPCDNVATVIKIPVKRNDQWKVISIKEKAIALEIDTTHITGLKNISWRPGNPTLLSFIEASTTTYDSANQMAFTSNVYAAAVTLAPPIFLAVVYVIHAKCS